MKRLGRRSLLVSGSAALLSAASACSRSQHTPKPRATTSKLTVRDPSGLLMLPEGFTVRVLQRRGDRMSDGYRVPARADAMACFTADDGSLVLMRNHEVTVGDVMGSPFGPTAAPPPEAYDPAGTGGVTRLVLDAETLAIKRTNLVLAGTYWNCAGGISPWGFLSCEETLEPGHGYVFLCRTDANEVQAPRRIDGYGRMRHEAAAVDPETNIAYLTEDDPVGAFYRFVPNDRETPFEGKLQALRIKAEPAAQTGPWARGEVRAIDWVDLPNPRSEADDLRVQAVRAGAAQFVRGEGLWLSGRDAFFCATSGGPNARGQVFRLRIDDNQLEVLASSTVENEIDMPDNITVSPHGQIYLAEDGPDGNSIRRLTLSGQVSEFARNVHDAGEFAGVCFAPDGHTMFVNLQAPGITLAIQGPFERALVSDFRDQDSTSASLLPRMPGGMATGLCLLALTAAARVRRDKTHAGSTG